MAAEGNISHKFEMPSVKSLPNPTFPLINFGINIHQRWVIAQLSELTPGGQVGLCHSALPNNKQEAMVLSNSSFKTPVRLS